MKRSFIRKIALLLALSISLSLCAFAAEETVDFAKKFDEALSLYENYSLFADENTDYIREALIASFEEDPEFFYSFMNKIYEKNDRYSHYLAPSKYEQAYGNTNVMVGIGVTISVNLDENLLVISGITSGSPAEAAGLKPEDRILSVDGIDVRGFAPAEAALAIRGKEGTSVNIRVKRGNEIISTLVKRAVITLSDVTSYIADDNIGYIELSQFEGISTFVDFIDASRTFKESGINTVVLDLRNNHGGALDCLINLMDNIIPEKDVPYLMTWQAQPLKLNLFKSEGYGWEFNKYVILINENTASAAEVLAGSLQELGYAVVVGKTSYGKGLGQRHIETSTGDEAVVSVLDLKLPVSGSYDGIGIKPDFEVDMKITPYKLPQLTKLKEKVFSNKIKPSNVKAIEERLSLLGYFFGEPDDIWDNKTVFAINMFCRYNNLPGITSVCSWDLTKRIDEETMKLEQKFIAEDTQLERAMKIAEEYSKSDKKAMCIDLSLVDFTKN